MYACFSQWLLWYLLVFAELCRQNIDTASQNGAEKWDHGSAILIILDTVGSLLVSF